MIVKLLLRLKLLILTVSLATTNIFAQDCESGILNSTTGNWGNEMTWELYSNADDTIIASFQGTQNYTTTEQTVCLEPGCYFFILSDSWGDGWNGGSLEVAMDNGVSLDIELVDGVLAYATFEIGETDACDYMLYGCTNPDAENYVVGATADDGSCLVPDIFVT